jgi:chromosome segregation ATPase
VQATANTDAPLGKRSPEGNTAARERDRLESQIRLLERQLEHAAKQLAEAERELARVPALEVALEETTKELEESVKELTRERDKEWQQKVAAHETIVKMQQTRVWRLGSLYWRIRDRILRRR